MKGLYEDITRIDPNAPMTRDNAAQMVWNALNATMVKYEGLGGQWTTVHDRIDWIDNNGNPVTLLGTKFNSANAEGILTNVSYNSTKKEYTYTIAPLDDLASEATQFKSKTDFSDLLGLNVKVVYKKNADKEVFGIVAKDSKILATGAIADIEYYNENTVKINDVSYKVDSAMSKTDKLKDLNAYAKNQMDTASDVDTAKDAYTFKAIDVDGDNKIDYVTFMPFTVGQVDYAGNTNINIDVEDADGTEKGTKSFKVEDNNFYDGIAEEDYVVIYASKNTPYSGDNIEAMEVVRGTVDSKSADETKYYIDGVAYENLSDDTLVVGNEYAFYVVGSNMYFFDTDAVPTLKDVVVVTSYQKGGTVDSAKVRATYADGTRATLAVNKIEKYESSSDKTTMLTDSVTSDDLSNMLYTVKENNGMYNLLLVNEFNALGNQTAGQGASWLRKTKTHRL